MSWLGYEIWLGPFVRAFCDRVGQLSADRFLAFRSRFAFQSKQKTSELDALRSENAELRANITDANIKIEQYHELILHLTSVLSECRPALIGSVRAPAINGCSEAKR